MEQIRAICSNTDINYGIIIRLFFYSRKIMNAETRSEIFARLLEKNPNPTTELNYSTAFELLVAVTLSAQATDKSV